MIVEKWVELQALNKIHWLIKAFFPGHIIRIRRAKTNSFPLLKQRAGFKSLKCRDAGKSSQRNLHSNLTLKENRPASEKMVGSFRDVGEKSI